MTAREALFIIQTIFDVSTGSLTNGGIELSEKELDYIIGTIQVGLEDTKNVQN